MGVPVSTSLKLEHVGSVSHQVVFSGVSLSNPEFTSNTVDVGDTRSGRLLQVSGWELAPAKCFTLCLGFGVRCEDCINLEISTNAIEGVSTNIINCGDCSSFSGSTVSCQGFTNGEFTSGNQDGMNTISSSDDETSSVRSRTSVILFNSVTSSQTGSTSSSGNLDVSTNVTTKSSRAIESSTVRNNSSISLANDSSTLQ